MVDNKMNFSQSFCPSSLFFRNKFREATPFTEICCFLGDDSQEFQMLLLLAKLKLHAASLPPTCLYKFCDMSQKIHSYPLCVLAGAGGSDW